MTFSLMRGHDRIQVVADLDPVAAACDAELGERMRDYPKILPAGVPDFGFAVQTGQEWRIGTSGGDDPEGSRTALASHLRRQAVTGTANVEELLAAAGRLDPEEGEPLAKDEWEIAECRYRVIRIEKFTLIHRDRGMEPPRVTDTDAPREIRLLQGHLIDPLIPAGQWETQLRLNLACLQPAKGTVPDDVAFDARHAILTHPGIVLLPPTYVVAEIVDPGYWKPLTCADGPGLAREALADHFAELLPLLSFHRDAPATPAELAGWARAAEQVRALPGPDFKVDGRQFRTVRVSRFMRLGPDGPEAPRPTDAEFYNAEIPG